jgi:hypothetical protein
MARAVAIGQWTSSLVQNNKLTISQAEVLLTINVSFLTIPSVVSSPESASTFTSTTPRLAIYTSVVATTGSMLIGFLLSSQVRLLARMPATEVVSRFEIFTRRMA